MAKPNADRVAALREGRTTYQGGPCPKGHPGLRQVSNNGCVHCNRDYIKSAAGKAVQKKAHVRYRSSNKFKTDKRFYELYRKYGLSREDYQQLAESQDHKCKICHKNSTDDIHGYLVVDHDHSTGRVRGLLCVHCNAGIGHLKDSTQLLASAIKYLTES